LSGVVNETRWLEGVVKEVVYSSSDTGYAVLRVQTGQELVVVVGSLAGLVARTEKGAGYLAFEGRFVKHQTHGEQFRAVGYVEATPTTLAGLQGFLASCGAKGVGVVTASRVCKHFGESLLHVLENESHRLSEVTGVGQSKAEALSQAWRRGAEGRALTLQLRGLGLSAAHIEAIKSRFGEQALDVVARTPYALIHAVRGLGFRTVDTMALKQGIKRDDPSRCLAAIAYTLEVSERSGHCFLPLSDLEESVHRLSVPTGAIEGLLVDVEKEGILLVETAPDQTKRVFLRSMYIVVKELASLIVSIATAGCAAPVDPRDVKLASRWAGVSLTSEQESAVKVGLAGGISVITGGPGTGKTTLVRVLVRAALERGAHYSLASPTGRAAKRLNEATGAEAKTLHRLLEYNPAEGRFLRDASNPLEGDGLVVDEASMVDVHLALALLIAIPQDRPFSIVFVGDAQQLPSVGPGTFLADIISSGLVPVIALQTIHRQAHGSGILIAAADILAGAVPQSGERSGTDDLFMVARTDADAARSTLLEIVVNRLPGLGFDVKRDVVVLAPTRRGPLGVNLLNEALQEKINPDGAPIRVTKGRLRLNDRVMCTKNRYDLEVFNGEMGWVVRDTAGHLEVDFDGRLVLWPLAELQGLDLAYAVTIHKSQGSEYPAVVLALHKSHGVMLQRELFYTAITRASRFAVVIGDPHSWAQASRRSRMSRRYTALAERIQVIQGESASE
jgi:exodeoxyribonuclease V alpha subunit